MDCQSASFVGTLVKVLPLRNVGAQGNLPVQDFILKHDRQERIFQVQRGMVKELAPFEKGEKVKVEFYLKGMQYVKHGKEGELRWKNMDEVFKIERA